MAASVWFWCTILSTLQQGACHSPYALCCHWLPPSLLFQPAVFLAVNPLLQVKRSKESLDCSLDLPLFSTSNPFVLRTCPSGKSSTPLPIQPNGIHFSFIQHQVRVGPGPALSQALSPPAPAGWHTFLICEAFGGLLTWK